MTESIKQPSLLFLDGHKSRINSDALELLYNNNIKVIVLPAHSSHITQPFDVWLASPLKSFFKTQSLEIPKRLENKLKDCSITAKNRYIRVLSIRNAWKNTGTFKSIVSAWIKSGLSPVDVQQLLNNKYIRESTETDVDEDNSGRCKIQINGMEITIFEKRLEISRHCNNLLGLMVPLPNVLSLKMRTGKENLLSSDCIFFLNIGFGYCYYKL